MPSLYALGWRQGSLFTADLPLDSVILGEDGQPTSARATHGRWAVASQDCDIDASATTGADASIELRPVHSDATKLDWGIRSSRYYLNAHEYAKARDPRTTISPAALIASVRAEEIEGQAPERLRGWKTWLGLRYDRPAVPDSLVELAKRIAEETVRRERRPAGLRVRDVLMQFDQTASPSRFSLFAVLEDPEDRQVAREWLASIGTSIPIDLGVLDEVEARDATGISLHVVETSYAADVTQLTWSPASPNPSGAE